MSRTMTVELSTPAGLRTITNVRRLRLEATDGSRGILPGHERARLAFAAGPIELVRGPPDDERVCYLATEGGVAQLDPHGVLLVCRWASLADSLDELRQQVLARRAQRSAAEEEARALAHRHEVATRRALAGLRREVPT
ncbi:FoF1 ATP synthase subunit delta/epsilon [Paraliomyxa miuraensis]|uniref:FoF1 ATP synthase subunit delta/epsilon n=1 Tax=Paraliomyxa miuraensis TaxID=376150 RepID=UPI00225AA459|nr:F0F1 ATP synthase subunit epsilon [Paraliomyxa miuraensis]MCX4244896.1 F0F1 ATP synthase subunit epsilon [Paraliomyxa miuraensis]